ncbi:NADAR family protein [Cytophagaceae bacterium DM2B3-1]|uniref:NADAR family protein n=1 Tax=Xanthocytophaga flava TaxID=3048013 RepID=A0ABT7CG94_9BACT|nr:NADAR family protein [Xanthocytophaga flavus]MDJ1492764.1 NADAR family protein [Xanthocytophaga flavus]
METEDIFFYSVSEAYGEFSNFALYPIKLKGKMWPTSEHYFQAQKFVGTPYEETIRKAISPMKAAELGRSRKVKLRRDWDSAKDNIMYEAIKAKFTQHIELAELLLETGDVRIIEHTENDFYWGDGGDGSGKNKLGKLLMKLREELKETYNR